MKIQASVTLSIVLIGLLAAYTIPAFTKWQGGELYFIWDKLCGFMLLRTVALLLKDKGLKYAFHAASCFFIVRLMWEVVAWRYGYLVASNKFLITWLFLITIVIITAIIIKAWKRSKHG